MLTIRPRALAEQLALVGEEAEVPPHVETENRHSEGSEMARSPENGAIAAQDHRQIRGTLFIRQQTREGIGAGTAHGHRDLHALSPQGFGAAASLAERRLTGGTMDQPDVVKAHGERAVRPA